MNLYYTVNKNRNEEEIVNDEYKNNENDYFNYDNFVKPNHNIGKK